MRIALVSDTHIGPNEQFLLWGIPTYEAARCFFTVFQNELAACDALIHLGDISAHGDDASYELFRSLIPRDVQTWWVCGNHDQRKAMCSHLSFAQHDTPFNLAQNCSYRVPIANSPYQLIFIDMRGPDAIKARGSVGRITLDWLENALASHPGKSILFTHFLPCAIGSPWLDSSMSLIEQDEFFSAIAPYRSAIDALYFGHVHNDYQLNTRGICLRSIPSTFCSFIDDRKKALPLIRQNDTLTLTLLELGSTEPLCTQQIVRPFYQPDPPVRCIPAAF